MASQENRAQNQTPSVGDLNPADLDKEIEQALGGASIEDLMAQAVSKGTPAGPTMDPSRPVRGGRPSAKDRGERTAPDNIKRGKVVAIREGNVFVDLGGKSQGMCPLEQFDEVPPEAAGEAPKGVEIGGEYEFVFKGYDSREGLVMLARRGATVHGPWETLQPGDIVEATVTGVNKGGL
ncbi:MAG: S1 RNA-binding domain-containing protein [Phycisphaerae bacterium]